MRMTRKIFKELEKRYVRLWPWPDSSEMDKDPFKKLIHTVLSQNTSDLNTARAYKELSSRFKVNPSVLARADMGRLKRAIRSGGLYNVKAKKIKEISKHVRDRLGGDVSSLLKLPKREAREKLMELPGVGDKTADVMLTSTHGYREVIPVDTHMERISKRLGLAVEDAGYDEIQSALLAFVPPKFRGKGFGYLWLFAKHTCRSRGPRCRDCLFLQLMVVGPARRAGRLKARRGRRALQNKCGSRPPGAPVCRR
jgi:endonuclease-3